MRNNGHITDREVFVSNNNEIVSSTDTRGNIQFCNDYFSQISGYTHEELIGQPHNILRHPHMPVEAFSMMWTALKAGRPWMGMVKNRCKNGDHYWVDAYVTPLREKGQIYGYESVRAKADPTIVKRAEKVYARLQQGKSIYSPLEKIWHVFGCGIQATAITAVLLLCWMGLTAGVTASTLTGIAFISVLVGAVSHLIARQKIALPLASARAILHDPIAAYIYTGRCDISGEVIIAELNIATGIRRGNDLIVVGNKDFSVGDVTVITHEKNPSESSERRCDYR